MERISNFITERLKLTSKTNYTINIDPNDYKDAVKEIAKLCNKGDASKYLKKIDMYYAKNEIPYDLIENTIDDELIKYWCESVIQKWNDAIKLFADEIVNKHLFTIEELHAFVIKYSKYSIIQPSMYKNYTDLYNINNK